MLKIISIILITFFTSSKAFSIETLDVYYQDRRPEVFLNSSKVLQGPIVDITRELLQNSNISPNFIFIPWTRSLHSAKVTKNNMLLIRHSMTEERKSFLSPIIYGQEKRNVHIYKRINSNVSIKSLKDLQKYNIGFRRGSFYFPDFSQTKKYWKTPIKSDQLIIKMLKNGRIDLMIFNQHKILTGHLNEMGIDFKSYFQKVEYVHTFLNPRFFSVPTKSRAHKFYNKLNCEMLKLRKSGFITKAFEKNSLVAPAQDFSDRYSKEQIKSCAKK